MMIECGKSYVTLDGIVHHICAENIALLKDTSFLCEYNGAGPDHLILKNWKDKDQKDYMEVEKHDIIDTKIGGTKHDKGKPMFSCLPAHSLLELGKVAELGARKYGLHNYRAGIKVSRTLDAAFRHLIAAIGNEDFDPVDGNNHLASAAWNCLVALQTIKEYPKLDDRYKPEKKS